MRTTEGAPYEDRVIDDGRVLIYEGHNVKRSSKVPNPRLFDQVLSNKNGTPTANGLFYDAVTFAKKGIAPVEKIRAFERLQKGLWVFNGVFDLTDAWSESDGTREVFKFRLELSDSQIGVSSISETDVTTELPVRRLIPSEVKQEVFKRDKGACVLCGSRENLHYDHDLPFSKGGTSLIAENIRLLCATHNLRKRDRIE